VVTLDDPEAAVIINGKRTRQKGKVRRFVTPELQPGETFRARIRVRWDRDGDEVERTQEVTVRGGQVKQLAFKAPSDSGEEPETMEPEQQLPKKRPMED